MQKRYFLMVLVFMLALHLQAQVSGCFPDLAGQAVSLSTYAGFQRTQVAATTVDSHGSFSLACPENYRGVAFLQFNNANGIEVIINGGSKLTVNGSSIQNVDSLVCTDNVETNTLYTYYKQQMAREQVLYGWKYLQKIYRDVPYFQKYKKTDLLNQEIGLLEKERTDFIKAQGADNYLAWYLPLVSMVRDIPMSVQHYPERIPEHQKIFMHTDFSDSRFYTSGLLPALMENYFFMLENAGPSPDSVYVHMNKATDYLIRNLQDKKPERLQETGLFLFNLFEKRSLFPAAEHVSLLMLAQTEVTLDSNTRNRFEGYRIMKKGNTASDINFAKAIAIQNEKKDESLNRYLKGYASLSGISVKYKLVIFGQGGCPDCHAQMQKIKQMYPEIQAHQMEVVYVSLDVSKADFEPVATEYPWVSYFDYGGWNSKPVSDYHVFASPTIYLLGEKLEILYKVVSPEHLGAILKVLE